MMIRIWNHMTENWSQEAGEQAYAIDPRTICDLFAGRPFAIRLPSLITEFGLAEQTELGLRIRGTYGRIEWLNRRRSAARDNGKLGGRKPNSVDPLSPSPSPSLSPAQLLSEKASLPRKARQPLAHLGFNRFWEAYPARNGRKVGRQEALTVWRDKKLEPRADEIIGALQRQNLHRDECKRAGVFCAEPKDAFRWLNKARWEDEVAVVPETDAQKNERELEAWARGES
jgi:hypothetical protein